MGKSEKSNSWKTGKMDKRWARWGPTRHTPVRSETYSKGGEGTYELHRSDGSLKSYTGGAPRKNTGKICTQKGPPWELGPLKKSPNFGRAGGPQNCKSDPEKKRRKAREQRQNSPTWSTRGSGCGKSTTGERRCSIIFSLGKKKKKTNQRKIVNTDSRGRQTRKGKKAYTRTKMRTRAPVVWWVEGV